MPRGSSYRVPRATYRIQFTPSFGFAQAREIVPYLADLGISDVYASPLLKPRPGSQHGYDVVDPAQINPELGGMAGFIAFSDDLRQVGMGLVLDIVPNHMAAHPENPWWWDVLKRGRESRYAEWFDIDWERGEGRIILPVLGDMLPAVLEREELRLARAGDEVELRYFEHRFPIRGESREHAQRLLASGEPSAILPLLQQQHYELVFWREGPQRINYRRFFDVSELAAACPECIEQMQESHALILDLVRQDRITGLRIDHIDGLADPAGYLAQLNTLAGPQQDSAAARRTGYYIVVEKILAPEETLPREWPICGTSGYDVLNILNELWIDPAGAETIFQESSRVLGIPDDFHAEMIRCKQHVIATMFPGDLRALAQLLVRAVPAVAMKDAETAVAGLTAALPVYRSYIRERVSDQDRRILERAFTRAAAMESCQGEARAALAGLNDLLSYPAQDGPAAEFVRRWQQFTGPVMAKGVEDTAMYRSIALASLNEVGGHPHVPQNAVERFHAAARTAARDWPHSMIATSTHDTKRSEDVRARISVLSEFPDEWLQTWRQWRTLNAPLRCATAKGEAPSAGDELLLYQTLLGVWPLRGEPVADFTERIAAYLLKAAREAKLRTNWTEPDEEYERHLRAFVQRLLDPRHAAFRSALLQWTERTALYGALNSLCQTVLKLTMPGVPDIYQGTELWDFSLVDPDNRRPVDYAQRRQMLAALRSASDGEAALAAALQSWRTGLPKLLITWRLLQARQDMPDVFLRGDYQPLAPEGPAAEHTIAFLRRHDSQHLLVACGRTLSRLIPPGPFPTEFHAWSDTLLNLPPDLPGRWRSLLTGTEVFLPKAPTVASLFRTLPATVLISQ